MKETYEGEILIQGQPGSSGIAIGDIYIMDITSSPVRPTQIKKTSVQKHKRRFVEAKDALISELNEMSRELKDHESSEIIGAQQQIIKDPEIEKKVYGIIEDKLLSVDFAVYQTYCDFIERLKESGSELFRQRIVDLEDIRDRLIDLVCNNGEKKRVKKGAVVLAQKVSPTDLVSFYEDGISGIVMEKGGITSHAVIIAQSLGIPCVVSAKNIVKSASNASKVVIDGSVGNVILDPGKEKIAEFREKAKALKKARRKARKGEVFETSDGVPFTLMANIEFEAEINKVKEFSAQGVGLLRTESLFFGKRFQKKEEEQQLFYENILKGMEGPLVIRLFDVGGDKGNIRSSSESNPFLGWRGIRMLLDEKDLLRGQLRSILRVAGKYPGRVKILVPMISVIDEIKEVKNEMQTLQKELASNGEEIDKEVQIGLMVEVPSVALSASHFAREVDFFSIGTNDLTQYTLAADRGNEHINNLFQHYHPSVLKLIKLTADASAEAEIGISVCGELAGDEIGAACLFGLGIRELSMAPGSIIRIKELLSSRPEKDFKVFAEQALEQATAQEIRDLFKKWREAGGNNQNLIS